MKLIITPGSTDKESYNFATILSATYISWAFNNCLPAKLEIHDKGFAVTLENPHPQITEEIGVHRLVRTSPFDEHGRRHTSFCKVDNVEGDMWGRQIRSYVLDPYLSVVHKDIEIPINPYQFFSGDIESLYREYDRLKGAETNEERL